MSRFLESTVKNESLLYCTVISMNSNPIDDVVFPLQCFGLDLAAAVGYFEGVFQVTYRSTRILLMGIPYSLFS